MEISPLARGAGPDAPHLPRPQNNRPEHRPAVRPDRPLKPQYSSAPPAVKKLSPTENRRPQTGTADQTRHPGGEVNAAVREAQGVYSGGAASRVYAFILW